MDSPQLTATSYNRDIITTLPAEVQLNITSRLPVKDLLHLKTVNRTFHALISHHERSISKKIIAAEKTRLENQITYFDLTGVPFDAALRRFVECYPVRQSIRNGNVRALGKAFAKVYHASNPREFYHRAAYRVLSMLLLAIDHFLQYDVSPQRIVSSVTSGNGLKRAVWDALDDTLAVRERYAKLLAILDIAPDVVSGEDMRTIIEDVMRVPIIHKGLRAPHNVASRGNLVELPFWLWMHVNLREEMPGAEVFVGYPQSAQRIVDACEPLAYLKPKYRRDLRWAAMMEKLEVRLV